MDRYEVDNRELNIFYQKNVEQVKTIYVFGGKGSGKKTFIEALKEYERVLFHSVDRVKNEYKHTSYFPTKCEGQELSDENFVFTLHSSKIVLVDDLKSFTNQIKAVTNSNSASEYEFYNSAFIYIYDFWIEFF